MENRFYIGQEVIAVLSHDDGSIVKGNTYTITGLRKGCSHCPVIVTVGITTNSTSCICSHCTFKIPATPERWYTSIFFKPKDNEEIPGFKEVTFTQIKEKVDVPQSFN